MTGSDKWRALKINFSDSPIRVQEQIDPAPAQTLPCFKKYWEKCKIFSGGNPLGSATEN